MLRSVLRNPENFLSKGMLCVPTTSDRYTSSSSYFSLFSLEKLITRCWGIHFNVSIHPLHHLIRRCMSFIQPWRQRRTSLWTVCFVNCMISSDWKCRLHIIRLISHGAPRWVNVCFQQRTEVFTLNHLSYPWRPFLYHSYPSNSLVLSWSKGSRDW